MTKTETAQKILDEFLKGKVAVRTGPGDHPLETKIYLKGGKHVVATGLLAAEINKAKE